MGKERHGLLAHQKGKLGKFAMNEQIRASIDEQAEYPQTRDRHELDLSPSDFRTVRRW